MTDSTISRYLETQIVWARSRQVLQIGNLTAADTELIWHQFTLMTLAREQHCTYTDDSFRGAPICPLMTSDDWRREQTQSSWERVNLSSNASNCNATWWPVWDLPAASPGPAPLMTKWLGAVAVWMAAWSWSFGWSAEKRPRAVPKSQDAQTLCLLAINSQLMARPRLQWVTPLLSVHKNIVATTRFI